MSANPNRRARRAARKKASVGGKAGKSVEVLVDRIALPAASVLDNDDPIGVVLAQLDDALRAFDVAGADLFDETAIRFGRHPSPSFKGELIIEIQSVRRLTRRALTVVRPYPVDEEGNPIEVEPELDVVDHAFIESALDAEAAPSAAAIEDGDRCLFVSRARNTNGARCKLTAPHPGVKHDLED